VDILRKALASLEKGFAPLPAVPHEYNYQEMETVLLDLAEKMLWRNWPACSAGTPTIPL
jgi:hypothetical protein